MNGILFMKKLLTSVPGPGSRSFVVSQVTKYCHSGGREGLGEGCGCAWGGNAKGVVPVSVISRARSPDASRPRSELDPILRSACSTEASASEYFFWWSWANARWYELKGCVWLRSAAILCGLS